MNRQLDGLGDLTAVLSKKRTGVLGQISASVGTSRKSGSVFVPFSSTIPEKRYIATVYFSLFFIPVLSPIFNFKIFSSTQRRMCLWINMPSLYTVDSRTSFEEGQVRTQMGEDDKTV
jgi:hypothetical protein